MRGAKLKPAKRELENNFGYFSGLMGKLSLGFLDFIL